MFLTSFFVHLFSFFLFLYSLYWISFSLKERALLKDYVFRGEEGFFLLSHPRSYCGLVAKIFSIEMNGFFPSCFLPKRKLRGDRLISFVSSYEVFSFSYKICGEAGVDDTMVISTSSRLENPLDWEETLSRDLNLKIRIKYFCNKAATGKG